MTLRQAQGESSRQSSGTTGLSNLRPNPGSTKNRKRVGRGPGSGLGKTSGRGEKGQKSRSGFARKPGFEGGQMPLFRRLPRRGFNNIFRVEYAVLNLQQLELFRAGATVGPDDFYAKGFIGKNETGTVKVLGKGKLTKALTVKAHRFSASAKDAIEKAGGKAELLGVPAAA
jgi:large subunit ribosomal protein L15